METFEAVLPADWKLLAGVYIRGIEIQLRKFKRLPDAVSILFFLNAFAVSLVIIFQRPNPFPLLDDRSNRIRIGKLMLI